MPIIYRRSLFVFAALLTIVPSARSADQSLGKTGQKVLGKEVGKWRSTYKLPKAEWTPEERTGTAEVMISRAVGDRFVQEKQEHSDKTSSMRMLTYDPQRQSYRGWWFSSTGQTAETKGKWDEDSKIMTWSSVGEAAFTTTVSEHFIDDDRNEWDVTVKDTVGKILYRMEGTSVRIRESK